MARKLSLLFLAALLCPGLTLAADDIIPKNVIKAAAQATLAIYVENYITGDPALTNPGGVNPSFRTLRGAGFFVDTEGTILTSYHVIEKRENLIGVLPDETEFKLEWVPTGYENKNDLAVLKVVKDKNDAQFPHGYLKLKETPPPLGSEVVAIGHGGGKPWSILPGTVNRGPCSGQNQSLVTNVNLVKFNPAILGGFSGGPVIDEMGEVVGVNNSSDDRDGKDNNPKYCSYATIVPAAQEFLDNYYGAVKEGLLNNKKTIELLGVTVRDFVFKGPGRWKKDNEKGVMIVSVVPGGFVDKLGLKSGDKIVKVGARVINNIADFNEAVSVMLSTSLDLQPSWLPIELVRDDNYNIFYVQACPSEKSFCGGR